MLTPVSMQGTRYWNASWLRTARLPCESVQQKKEINIGEARAVDACKTLPLTGSVLMSTRIDLMWRAATLCFRLAHIL